MLQQLQPEQIDRDYVRLLMVMRRLVRDEFNTRVPISEAGATIKLLDFAQRSGNRVLQEMGKELRGMLSADSNHSTAQAITSERSHCYRGVAQPPMGAADATAPVGAQPGTVTRIYRGRLVAG